MVPGKGMQAVSCFFLGPHYYGQTHLIYPAEITFRRCFLKQYSRLQYRKCMLTPLSYRSIKFFTFRKDSIIRHGQIGQTDAFQYRPTALISLSYLFRQCTYFSTVLISLLSLFQCCKFFQRVPKTLAQYAVLLNKLLEIALILHCLDFADQLKNTILKDCYKLES